MREAVHAVCCIPCVPIYLEALDPVVFRHFILQKSIIYVFKD